MCSAMDSDNGLTPTASPFVRFSFVSVRPFLVRPFSGRASVCSSIVCSGGDGIGVVLATDERRRSRSESVGNEF